jgi:hypothetical protein
MKIHILRKNAIYIKKNIILINRFNFFLNNYFFSKLFTITSKISKFSFEKKNYFLQIFLKRAKKEKKLYTLPYSTFFLKKIIVHDSVTKEISKVALNQMFGLNFYLTKYNIGFSSKLEFVGYTRRAWISKSYIYANLGNSYINKIILKRFLYFNLTNKRIFSLYSNNETFLNNFIYNFIKLKPTDAYKRTGIVFYNVPLKLKKRRIQAY